MQACYVRGGYDGRVMMQGGSGFFARQAGTSALRQLAERGTNLEEIMTQERPYRKAEAHARAARNGVCQLSCAPRDLFGRGWPSQYDRISEEKRRVLILYRIYMGYLESDTGEPSAIAANNLGHCSSALPGASRIPCACREYALPGATSQHAELSRTPPRSSPIIGQGPVGESA